MLHAIYTFNTETGYYNAFLKMVRLSTVPYIKNHVQYRFFDEYRIGVISYEDNSDGIAAEYFIYKQLNEFADFDKKYRFDAEYPFLEDDFDDNRYFSVELDKNSAKRFKEVLRDYRIKYESSECFNLIHFEVWCNDLQRYLLDDYLRRY